MKKIINGKLYNTETAKMLADWWNGRSGFDRADEELYLKRTGEYFLYGQGGPMSRYAKSISYSEWSGGEKITPLTEEGAKKWALNHLDADEYMEIFGEVEE